MHAETKTIRTLIVDDHPVVRYGLQTMLSADPAIDVVGELEQIDTLSDVLADLKPDVLVLDLELDDSDGAHTLSRLHEIAPKLGVIIFTSYDDEERIVQAAELGVDGYLLKGCKPQDLLSAIHSVSQGGKALESSVGAKLMNYLNRRSSDSTLPSAQFSKREIQVLQLLATGKTNRKIGEQLFISESTVKFHVHAILGKLDVGNRTEAVSIAAQRGIIEFAEA